MTGNIISPQRPDQRGERCCLLKKKGSQERGGGGLVSTTDQTGEIRVFFSCVGRRKIQIVLEGAAAPSLIEKSS